MQKSRELKLPKELLLWIDEERGGMSRYAFIIHHMIILMNESKRRT